MSRWRLSLRCVYHRVKTATDQVLPSTVQSGTIRYHTLTAHSVSSKYDRTKHCTSTRVQYPILPGITRYYPVFVCKSVRTYMRCDAAVYPQHRAAPERAASLRPPIAPRPSCGAAPARTRAARFWQRPCARPRVCGVQTDLLWLATDHVAGRRHLKMPLLRGRASSARCRRDPRAC